MTPEQQGIALNQLDTEHVKICTHCHLHESRTNTVFGEGADNADLMFVGEGPGVDEDAKGRPFVGRAGQLLDKQIAAMGLTREQVYIANTVKCRPPGNRVPTPDEADHCRGYLDQQIQIIAPKVIVCLGATAAKYLLNDMKLAITRVRGQWRTYRGIDLMPTFHPAYLLRQYTQDNRRKVWSDLQAVMERLGLPVPSQ
ncbi:MAG: uracil-DNA glycosylase [Planctomycetaceae bacterium]|nr:uracil-DNA glycosylase [Planctomycetaceae bacterium]